MANTKSAEKAARQSKKHRGRNVTLLSRMRTAVRKVSESIAAGKKDEATANYKAAASAVDSLVNKNLVHRNKASRHKSRLAAKLKALAKK